MELDDDYITVNKESRYEINCWRKKNDKYFEELEGADIRIRELQTKVRELEDQLEDYHEYKEKCNGKCTCYGGSLEHGLGTGSPALSTLTSGPSLPVSQAPTTYARTLQVPPRVNVQEDVVMEEGELGRFPPLPNPSQPLSSTVGTIVVPRGANWNPAPRGRPGMGMRGGIGARPSREPLLLITSLAQLDHYLEAANRPGDETAVAQMCAYVREAHLLRKEE